MNVKLLLYTLGVLIVTAGLPIFAYLDRVYRELNGITTGRVRAHLEVFEAEIEPRFKMERPRLANSFNLIARLWLVLVAAFTARGVIFFAPNTWQAAAEMVVFLGAEVAVLMQFVPALLLAGVRGTGFRRSSRCCARRCGLCIRLNPCSTRWCLCCTFRRKSKRRLRRSSRSRLWWMRRRKRESSSRRTRA